MPFQINIDVQNEVEKSTVRVAGSEMHVISDAERRTFGLGDEALKKAVEACFGKRPNDAYVCSPTPWGDLYKTYNWEQVTVHLRAVEATLTDVSTKPLMLKEQIFRNNSSIPGFFDVSISSDVSDTTETNWSQTVELSFTQSVSYGVGVFGGETSMTLSTSFQQGGSTSRSVTVGQSSGIQVELQPHTSVKAILSSALGTLKIRVVFEAYLSGVVAVNYNPTYRDHHFWALGVDAIRQTVGLPNVFRIVNDVTVGVYSKGETTLEDNDNGGRPTLKLAAPISSGTASEADGEDIPTMGEIFDDEPLANKGTAGQDAQKRRNKGLDDALDEPMAKKGTAGQDAQNRRNKGLDDSLDEPMANKGTAGTDAQKRRSK